MAKSKKSKKNSNFSNKKGYSVENKKVDVAVNSSTPFLSNAVKCVVAVVVILILSYFLARYITNKNKLDSIKVSDAVIQYEVILAGESFNQNKKDYMILYFDDTNIGDYSSVLSEYYDKKDKVALYKCYTNEALNKKFVSQEENRSPEVPEDLRVKENTLIRFKDNKVVEYITGKDDIISYLKEL